MQLDADVFPVPPGLLVHDATQTGAFWFGKRKQDRDEKQGDGSPSHTAVVARNEKAPFKGLQAPL